MADVKVWVQGTKDYISELRQEMKRVSWPNRKQVEATTGVVLFAVFAFAAYFWVIDAILGAGVHRVLRFFTGR